MLFEQWFSLLLTRWEQSCNIHSMSKLLKHTINLTKAAKEAGFSDADISGAAGVGKRWFSYFRSGKYEDPGVIKTEKLHDFLMSLDLPKADDIEVDRTHA